MKYTIAILTASDQLYHGGVSTCPDNPVIHDNARAQIENCWWQQPS